MTEQEVFETRLRAALAVHVANGLTDFDAHAFARAVVEAEPRRHGRSIALRRPRILIPRIAWVVVATALLVTVLAASALLAGARPFAGPSSWQRIVLPFPTGTTGQMADVVRAGSGYLAVGSTTWHTGDNPTGLVWTSADGLTWDLVPTGDTFTNTELNAVVAGDGGYAVVGSTWDDEGPSSAAAWVSADGQTWRRAASIAAPEGAVMGDVAYARGRYVAGGWELRGALVPRIWQSDDADHWVPATDFDAAPSYMGVISGVAAGGPGFVAVGWDPGIWTSSDGNTWTIGDALSAADRMAGLEPTTHPVAVASGHDGLVVVGADSGETGWTRTSGDGKTWTSAALPGPDGSPASGSALESGGIVATDWGFVALSTWSPYPDASYRDRDPIDVQGGLWTSRDGIRWTLHELDPQFAASQAPKAVSRRRGGPGGDERRLPDGDPQRRRNSRLDLRRHLGPARCGRLGSRHSLKRSITRTRPEEERSCVQQLGQASPS